MHYFVISSAQQSCDEFVSWHTLLNDLLACSCTSASCKVLLCMGTALETLWRTLTTVTRSLQYSVNDAVLAKYARLLGDPLVVKGAIAC